MSLSIRHLTLLSALCLEPWATPVFAAGTVSTCDEANFNTALTGGGTVTFACSGTINLTTVKSISANTILDGAGQTVTLTSGVGSVFTIGSGQSLSFKNLTLTLGGNNPINMTGGGSLTLDTVTIQNSAPSVYGVIMVSHPTLPSYVTFTNSQFRNNIASGSSSGGMTVQGAAGSTLTINGCVFDTNWGSGNYAGTLVLQGATAVTISNSQFLNNKDASNGPYGGAIGWAGTNSLNITGSTFRNNTTGNGGAIYIMNSGTVTIDGSTFDSNTANSGGVIYATEGSLTITNSTFTNNQSVGSGGAIYLNSGTTATINTSTFTGNRASYTGGDGDGGAIVNDQGTLTINDSTFTNNQTTISGGGQNGGALVAGANSNTTINRSTFTGNSATYGGAIFVWPPSTLSLSNSTLTGNTAGNASTAGISSGGGIYFWSGGAISATLKNVTIANNSISGSLDGAGLRFDASSSLSLSNSIFANNTSVGGTNNDCYLSTGTLTVDTNNLIMSGNCGTPAVTANPLLGTLASNGGTTQTLALSTGSPALEAGDDASCVSPAQNGVTRPLGVHCDIGAYELPLYTLTLATSGAGIGNVSSSGSPVGTSCGTNCLSYLSTTAVTMTATATGGSTFGGWSCTPAFTSGNVLTANTTCTATFTYDPVYNLTLATAGTGTGTVSSSGTPSGVSCGADCLTYITTTTVTLTATGTNGSTVAGWSCTPAFTSGNTLTANTTCTATFEAATPIPHYHLSVQTDGTGTGIVTGAGSYPAGTTVTLEAVPDKDSTFVGWSAGCSNEMTLTADITCTATFMGLPPPRTLYITFAGTGQGQLSGGLASDATGINCSTTTPTCSYTVFGTQWVYPKFIPATGSELAGWSGDPACTQDGSSKILLLQDTHCTVTVNLKLYTLSVGRNVPGVTLTSDGLNCQDTPEGFRNLAGAAEVTTCQATYPYGTTVKITASPAPLEWEWVGWKGSCDNQGQVVITQDRLCQAQYREDPNVPNGMDGNGDGENDARQPNVMSLPDKVAGSYITLVVNPECVVADSSTLLADSLDGHDPNHPAPQGLMYFELNCSQTPVTMYFHGVNRIPRNVELLKYGPTIPGDEKTVGWYELPNVQFGLAMVGGKPVATVTYTLTDGQLGDNTGVDGKIVDPAGLGLK